MVRFSCFSTPPLIQKPKKDQRLHCDLPSTSQRNNAISNSFSQEELWKMEYMNSDSHERVSKEEFSNTRSIKRSQSLGCVLDDQNNDLSVCLNEESSSSIGNDSHETLFSIEFLKQSDEYSNEFAFKRSRSTSNFKVDSDSFEERDENVVVMHRSRSFLNFVYESIEDRNESDDEEHDIENVKNINDKYSHIEAWIRKTNVEDESSVQVQEEETSDCSFSFLKQETEVEADAATPNIRPGSIVRNKLGTEVAYNYISSLNAASTSAQIVNLRWF